VAVIVALEAMFDVSVRDAVVYLAYELGFIVLPGWLALRALRQRPDGPLGQLALGWGLGYVLEIVAFLLTAATGTRPLLAVYPVLVIVPAALVVRSRGEALRSPGRDRRPSSLFGWAVAACCVAVTVYIAIAYFVALPLPGSEGVAYQQDFPWHLSLAADAKHHWPIQDPNVAGEPLPYHYFVHLHLAAASRITGLGLPVVYLRLFILPLVVLAAVQLVVAGRSLTGSRWAGVVGAILALLVGQLTLDVTGSPLLPFRGTQFAFLYTSPSFLFGLIMLLPLLVLVGERLSGVGGRGTLGDWLLIALFAVGASDAKVAILPLLLVALAIFGAVTWVRERRLPVAALWCAAVLAAVEVMVYAMLYKGHPSGFVVDLQAGRKFFEQMPAVVAVKGQLADALGGFPGRETLLTIGAMLFGAFGLFAPQLVGIAWVLRRQGMNLRRGQLWALCILLAGLLVLLFLRSPGTGNQLYFLGYGVIAGCLVSGEGLRLAGISWPSLAGRSRRLAACAISGLLVLVAVLVAPGRLPLFRGPRDAHTVALQYGAYVVMLGALYVVARRLLHPSRWAAGALVSAALLVAGIADIPVTTLRPGLDHPPRAVTSGKRMTPELYHALRWISASTPADALIAVNNRDALQFAYPAFAERRVFFGGWGYSEKVRAAGYPGLAGAFTLGGAGTAGASLFGDRLALNDSAFRRADSHALVELEARGVRYLLIDEVNGYPTDESGLRDSGNVVFSARGVLVIELRRS
jgi:hypothetical protein